MQIAPQTPARLLVWKVFRLKPHVAAIRHRALFPMIGLQQRNWSQVVLERNQTLKDWSAASALIISNSYRDDDVELARAASSAGVLVVVDICDNVFIGDIKGDRGQMQRRNFEAIAGLSTAITVPSPYMAETVASNLGQHCPISVIPDQNETLPETRAAFDTEAWLEKNSSLRKWSWKDQRMRFLKRAKRRLGLKKADLAPERPTPPREPGRKRLVWFGHHGEFGKSGLWALADAIPALEAVNARCPIELLVVSNSEEKFRDLISTATFPTLYTAWHPFQVFRDIESADLCVLPNARDCLTLAKSAGRIVMALGLGVPVAATMVSSLETVHPGLFDGVTEESVTRALTDEAECRRRLEIGKRIVEGTFSGEAVAERWDALLTEATKDA